MSLKKFHIVFISISTLLCIGLIFWGIWDFKLYGEMQGIGLAIVGGAGVALLAGYLRWFLKKYSKMLAAAFGLWVGVISSTPIKAVACAVCYKDPDNILTKSTLLGVWVLLAVIVGVLVSIFLIGRSWVKRARALGQSF